MITRERHNEIVDEFIEHGILSHNIKLLHYGNLLIEAIPTFNSPELISFDELVFLVVVTSIITLNRT